MARQGTVSTNAYDGRYYTLTWSLTKQSVVDNSSLVAWNLEAVGGNSSTYAEYTVRVKINGLTVFTKTNKVNRAAGAVSPGSLTIFHDENGDSPLDVSIEAAVGGETINCTASSRFALETVARKSTITASNGVLGTEQTLTVNRKDDSFTHTITYKCGEASGTICEKSSATSIKFVPPLSLANQSTNGSAVSLTFTIETFTGSTSLGKATTTIKCSMPGTGLEPVISVSFSDESGNYGKYGVYVQGASKLKVTITAHGVEGATITGYSATFDGGTYFETDFTTGVIMGSGALPLEVVVTDSRGQKGVWSQDIDVVAYSAPKITALTAYRSNSSGTSSPNGSYLTVKFSSEVAQIGSVAYTLQYKRTDATSYTSKTLSAYANNFNVVDGKYTFSASASATYDIILTADDGIKSTSKSATGSSQNKLWSIFARGAGIALGKIATLSGWFDVDMPARFRKGIEVDGSWTALTVGSKFEVANSDSNNTPMYKRMGSVVTIKGCVVSTAEISYLLQVPIASGLPSEACPSANMIFAIRGNNGITWNCIVMPNGNIMPLQYSNFDEVIDIPSGAVLQFNVTYMV